MAELINTNVFEANKKFVDFAGLDYFWGKAKAYVDAADKVTADKVTTLEGVVGNDASGLVKALADLKATVDGLGNIEGGSLSDMIDAKIQALDVEDAAVAGQYVSSVAEVDGKIVVTRENLPVYEEVGVAAGLNNAMDARVKVLEAIDHDALASDAAASAVATILDGAPEKFDTLKEVAQWIADSESASNAADLVTRVAALEAIDHDAYVEADKALENSLKEFGSNNYDVKGAAATAKSEAIADADGKLALKANAADVYTKTEADGKFQVAGNYETAGTAQSLIDSLKLSETYDAKGAAATAEANAKAYAKTYTDELYSSIKFAEESDIDGLFPVTEPTV